MGGRSISYFTFAHDQRCWAKEGNVPMHKSLGEHGYFVFSGYDLWPVSIVQDRKAGIPAREWADDFRPTSVEGMKARLECTIRTFRESVGDKHFTLAMPFAASCHEYEQYVPMSGEGCGPACKPYDNKKETDTNVADYVQGAFDVVLSPEVAQQTGNLFCMVDGESQFLGMSWWVFTYTMTYPSMRWFDNNFMPAVPSDDALSVLAEMQPRLHTDACASAEPDATFANGKWATVDEWVPMDFDLPKHDPFVCEEWINSCGSEFEYAPSPRSPSFLRAQRLV